MDTGEKNYIQYERVAVLFIPGFIQFENNKKLKSLFFIISIIGLIFLSLLTKNSAYSIGLIYVYAFAWIDSISIAADDKIKRTSISEKALEIIDRPDKNSQQQINFNNFERGRKFEEFVMKRFDKKEFTIVKMTVPVQKVEGPFIENNLDPDFIFRYKPNLEKFAVEAKFRGYYGSQDYIECAKPYQLSRYRQFEKEEKIPVYIILGYGGIPEDPQKVFLIPLDRIKSHQLSLNFLSQYEVHPNQNFVWRPGSVWNSGYLKSEK